MHLTMSYNWHRTLPCGYRTPAVALQLLGTHEHLRNASSHAQHSRLSHLFHDVHDVFDLACQYSL
jgi:hypothetical protein